MTSNLPLILVRNRCDLMTWFVLLISVVVFIVMGGFIAVGIFLFCLFVMFLLELLRIWSKL